MGWLAAVVNPAAMSLTLSKRLMSNWLGFSAFCRNEGKSEVQDLVEISRDKRRILRDGRSEHMDGFLTSSKRLMSNWLGSSTAAPSRQQ